MIGLAAVLIPSVSGHAQEPGAGLRGFSAASAQAQLAREREFMRLPSTRTAEQYFDAMTAKPHHTGSPFQIELADYVADRFRSFGLEVSRYRVRRAHPVAR